MSVADSVSSKRLSLCKRGGQMCPVSESALSLDPNARKCTLEKSHWQCFQQKVVPLQERGQMCPGSESALSWKYWECRCATRGQKSPSELGQVAWIRLTQIRFSGISPSLICYFRTLLWSWGQRYTSKTNNAALLLTKLFWNSSYPIASQLLIFQGPVID